MTRTELIHQVMSRGNLNSRQAESALEAILETISDTLASGDDVRLIGFGRFHCEEMAERKCRNPHTQETIIVPARIAIRFSPSKNLESGIQVSASANDS